MPDPGRAMIRVLRVSVKDAPGSVRSEAGAGTMWGVDLRARPGLARRLRRSPAAAGRRGHATTRGRTGGRGGRDAAAGDGQAGPAVLVEGSATRTSAGTGGPRGPRRPARRPVPPGGAPDDLVRKVSFYRPGR